jgi:hypothetical protein
MNLRCSFCQTPYTLSRVAMLDALQEVDAGNLSHYDAHCPKCRRANPIPRQKLEMAMPKWRDELKQFEKEMKQNPQQEAPLPTAVSVTGAQAAATPEPAAAKKGSSKPKQTGRPTVEGSPKPAARQTTPSADTQKSNARRSTGKGSSKKSK